MLTPEFPDWFPEDCPPSTAADAEGEYFRIVAAQVVSEPDFLSHHELGTALGALSLPFAITIARYERRFPGARSTDDHREDRVLGILRHSCGSFGGRGSDTVPLKDAIQVSPIC